MLKEYVPHIYQARPQESLKDHLFFVWTENKNIWKNYMLNWKDLKEIFYIVWVLHDLGKYTKIFQYYLKQTKDNDINLKIFIDNYKEHAIFGAFFYFYLISKNINNLLSKWFEQKEIYLVLLAWFYAITKHHSNLQNVDDITDIDWLNKKIDILKEQTKYIDYEIINKELWELFSKWKLNLDYSIKEFVDMINNKWFVFNFRNIIENNCIENIKNTENIIYLKSFYSSLVYADKYKTIFQDNKTDYFKLEQYDLINDFKKIKWHDKTKDSLNMFRNNIYNDVKSNLKKINLDNHIYTLNAPTWAGKTYNLLNIWLYIKWKLEKNNKNAKIIYGLPFTSIIDQVFEDIFNILEVNGYDKNTINKILSKHHYLTAVKFNNENEDIIEDYDKQKFRINAWDNEIVVTTFFQIFHTIFWNKNKRAIKYPNFQNAIFILDEIQTTPYKYWWNFKKMFQFLAEYMNCYFVLSSATLPMIFDKNEAIELLPNNQTYFDQLDRTNLDLSFLSKDIELDEFYENIENSLNKNSYKDHMIILNTIKSSLKVYKKIKQNLDNKKNEIIYLSTNIIPKHRKERIQKIKNNSWKRIILICTQLIEAWVDIDLDIWFRDFGPIDSIVQVLWRLNRNNKKEKWELKLFSLIDEDSARKQKFTNYIYDPLSLSISKGLFDDQTKIPEKDYKILFDRYFELVQENKSKDIENELFWYWNDLKFQDLDKNFKLIENTYETIDIFVPIDKEAENLIKQFEDIRKIKNKFERKKHWDMIKWKFLQYVISVDSKKVVNCWFADYQLERWLIILDDEFIKEYYDKDIGFNVVNQNNILEDNFI